tara:strand:+ start:657 stop:878 length:222 start_codon:yes stop_codon:yes gene_type:complete
MDKFLQKYLDTLIVKEIGRVGINHRLVSSYKTGKSKPKPKNLVKICFVLSVYYKMDIDDLLFEAVQYITGDIK